MKSWKKSVLCLTLKALRYDTSSLIYRKSGRNVASMEEKLFSTERLRVSSSTDTRSPSLKQDTNLHYVGITKAENYCILMRVSLR